MFYSEVRTFGVVQSFETEGFSMKRSAGIFITATNPWTKVIYVFLRLRGEYNPEEALNPRKQGVQSLVGCAQPSAHGKAADDDVSLRYSVLRELGEEISQFIEGMAYWANLNPIYILDEPDNYVEIYHIHVPWEVTTRFPLDVMRPFDIRNVDQVEPIDMKRDKDGVWDRRRTVMFQDQIDALKIIASNLLKSKELSAEIVAK